MNVSGKVAVVTGGASGIGRGIALALAGRGSSVVVADIEGDRAETVAAEVRAKGVAALAVACDVTKKESVEALADRAFRELGDVQLVFNNAGVLGSAPSTVEATVEELQWILSVNVVGVWNGCAAFLRRFRDSKGERHIVNTASEHALGVPHAGQGFYTASKHAVLALSDVLRAELPPNIGISVLCPGLVQSNLWDAARNRPGDVPAPPSDDPRRAVSKAVMERGKDAIEIGRRAVEGVERGDFLIVTHPHAVAFAERRWREIQSAFEAQAPYSDGCEKLDVNAVVQDVLRERRGS